MDGKISIATELETKTIDAQIKELEHKLDVMIKTLESDNAVDISVRMSDDERLKLESDIEKTKNRILSLKSSLQEVGNESEKTNNKMSKGFKKNANNLKRFALNLLSVGSLLAVVSKASSTYLSENEELGKKLQSVWVGLGSFLAPAIEYISDLLLKGLGYLNEFIKALTGVDFIARANAKAIEKQAKAQKELNRQTQQYDFDVIRTQQNTSSGGSISGSSSGLIEIPELDQKLVKKLQDLAYWLKENWHWISEVGKILLITFGAYQIGKILSGIGLLLGSGGLGGLATALALLATVYIVKIAVDGIVEAIEQVKELNRQLDKNIQQEEKNTKKIKENKKNYMELSKAQEITTEQQEAWLKSLRDLTDTIFHQNQNLVDQKNSLSSLFTGTEKYTKQQAELKKQMESMLEQYRYLYETRQLDEQGIKDYQKALMTQMLLLNDTKISVKEVYDEMGNKIGYETVKEISGEMKNLKAELELITKNPYNVEVVANLKDNISKGVETLLKSSQSILSKFGLGGSAFNAMFTAMFKGIKSLNFAQGGIVTQPTRALIGEAGYPEAVVPMTNDYLSTLASAIGQYSGGNGTTNVYLDGRLIQRQINNRQNKVNFATNR